MVQIGKFNSLKAVKKSRHGMYLDGGDLGEILLPKKYTPTDLHIDESIEVFVYRDSEDRLVATTQKPKATVDQFAYLKVVSISTAGAFLDWGLEKDLMVPYREQKQRMEVNNYYLVSVYLDTASNRIAASAKLDYFLNNLPAEYEENQEVDLIIWQKTDLGYKVIINESHSGVLYSNEIFQELKIGERTKGFIKKIREDEKIDVVLSKPGYEKIGGLADEILTKLKKNNGFIALNDKSEPEAIKELFGVSKKSFKKAIGALYKGKIIKISEEGITLM